MGGDVILPMHYYTTKIFSTESWDEEKIDRWLNSFINHDENVPNCDFNASLVGYSSAGNKIVITLLVYDHRRKEYAI